MMRSLLTITPIPPSHRYEKGTLLFPFLDFIFPSRYTDGEVMNVNKQMDAIWDYVWNCLYCEKTSLIYDMRTTREKDGNIVHLPTPEEIAREYPNPCGWTSGMENSMINGGMMLDTVLNRYEKTGDPAMKGYADKLFLGIKRCAEISGSVGFLARSISPFDGKSYFPNSSRDQYTHVVYGLTRYFDSPLCTDKDAVKQILVNFAHRAEQNVTPENEYDMLRADGKVGLVAKLWDVWGWNEWLRLLMIYMAAYHVSGDTHWLDLYKPLRDEGIEKSQPDPDEHGSIVFQLQMQLSVRLLYDHDPDEEYRAKYLDLLQKVAALNVDRIEEFRSIVTEMPWFYNIPVLEWREPQSKDFVVVNGEKRATPARDPYQTVYHKIFFNLSNVFAMLYKQALCPDYAITDELLNAFSDVANVVDAVDHCTETPIYALAAYWAM